ncbi:putative nuclease HARBI1 [Merluccius polli]|uniref:Nuclease HARBI1 n=1 Tax=Merluccius polli TaxID=89951 RepID=A0AA47P9E1_MERPO|nr:putative nuclease HARBI1 [Merluccius polli]
MTCPFLEDVLDEEALILRRAFNERVFRDRSDPLAFGDDYLNERYRFSGTFSGVLLGDKGYTCESFLLTPLADPQTPSQQAYDHAHNKTRARIEMTFGLLKSRFQCLHHLRVSPDRACDVIAACAVVLQSAICTLYEADSFCGWDRVCYCPSRECQLLRWGHILAWWAAPLCQFYGLLTATIIQTFNMSADTYSPHLFTAIYFKVTYQPAKCSYI